MTEIFVCDLGALTFPPACERTAKQKRVEGLAFPSTVNSPNAAAWPSMGWDTFLSTEYSCIAPTTRFCCRAKRENKSIKELLRHRINQTDIKDDSRFRYCISNYSDNQFYPFLLFVITQAVESHKSANFDNADVFLSRAPLLYEA